MCKRKRDSPAIESAEADSKAAKLPKINGQPHDRIPDAVIQIVTGSYERVLHGLTATISRGGDSTPAQFANTFLFNAHSSAIRCLALSPLPEGPEDEPKSVLLASGGTDERINLYSLSTSPPVENHKLPSVPSLDGKKISENPFNRELGALLQHSSTITSLYFPTRSKLLSGSEDNTIAISRTRDLSVISTVKAPRPKAVGQPSGDTAPQGTAPAGINDFAVHPSMKVMVSVGKGEKCMRLWNLITGKKAGVLNFGREVLQSVKEGKYSHGEGRRIEWNPEGDEFAVAFERGVVVFGEDSRPKCRVLPMPRTKIHQVCYKRLSLKDGGEKDVLAVSTEDGRIVFYSTGTTKKPIEADASNGVSIPDAQPLAQLGGKEAGISGRVKDFEIITLKNDPEPSAEMVLIITASSDGSVRVWELTSEDITPNKSPRAIQVGKLLGTYETESRITCLKAFLMQGSRPGEGLSEFEGLTEDGASDESSDSDGGGDQ